MDQFGIQGQPALLYLIPCTLGLCMLLAWRRGEVRSMWHGLRSELKRTRFSGSTDPEEAEGNAESDGLLGSQRGSLSE